MNFIKADIEGFERLLLKGAQNVLSRYEPQLVICTYHLPGDPYTLKELILQTNPKYKIYQGKAKLFAIVEN